MYSSGRFKMEGVGIRIYVSFHNYFNNQSHSLLSLPQNLLSWQQIQSLINNKIYNYFTIRRALKYSVLEFPLSSPIDIMVIQSRRARCKR